MQSKQPSQTALRVAEMRAAHQILEGGSIFKDPLAAVILGEDPRIIADRDAAMPAFRPVRLFVAARSRFAEDIVSAAVARGVRQAVVLGAGYDTFALRNPHAVDGLHVFELDHPATQDWKRERLRQAGVTIPSMLTFVSVDFEHQDFLGRLRASGFRTDVPACFLWLGVVPYLTRETVGTMLRAIAGLPASEIVLDYIQPLENYPPAQREFLSGLQARAAALGEPGRCYVDPPTLHKDLRRLGFVEIDDLGPAAIAARFFARQQDEAASRFGPHIVHARRVD